MLAVSTLWKFDPKKANDYFAPFWERNIYSFEWMEGNSFDSKLLENTPLKVCDLAMKIPDNEEEERVSLCSENSGSREKAVQRLLLAAQSACLMKTPYLVVWPGKISSLKLLSQSTTETPGSGLGSMARQSIAPWKPPEPKLLKARQKASPAYLERLCRSIFEASRKYPDIVWCIPPARNWDEVPFCEELDWICSDLNKTKIAYWHNTASCHIQQKMGLSHQEAWLERFGSRTAGLYLEDVAGEEAFCPPGSGEIQFGILKRLLPSQATKVLRISSHFNSEDIWLSCLYLRDKGLLTSSEVSFENLFPPAQ